MSKEHFLKPESERQTSEIQRARSSRGRVKGVIGNESPQSGLAEASEAFRNVSAILEKANNRKEVDLEARRADIRRRFRNRIAG
ncbi:hypothetical protein JXD20_03380 [Candidatus Peregrinibacteria bacterium]|nr:hypothetical protein [Candidatus Peregrinibacteria bacterium]